jgi:hypothetical protein
VVKPPECRLFLRKMFDLWAYQNVYKIFTAQDSRFSDRRKSGAQKEGVAGFGTRTV